MSIGSDAKGISCATIVPAMTVETRRQKGVSPMLELDIAGAFQDLRSSIPGGMATEVQVIRSAAGSGESVEAVPQSAAAARNIVRINCSMVDW